MNEKKKMKCLYAIIIALVIVIVTGGVGVTVYFVVQNNMEKEARLQVEKEKKEKEDGIYNQGKSLCDIGKYEEAITLLAPYNNIERVADLSNLCYLKWGQSLIGDGKYEEAIKCLKNYEGSEKDREIAKCNKKIKEKEEEKRQEQERKKKEEKAQKKAAELENNRLIVGYNVYQSEDDENGIIHKNGEGKIKLLSDIPLDEWTDEGTYVTYTMPESSINFKLSNVGEKDLNDIKFIISFDGMAIKNLLDCPGFEEQVHINGVGGVASAVKTIDKIQSGMEVSFNFSMREAYSFNGEDGGNMKITVTADGYKAHTYTVPIHIA